MKDFSLFQLFVCLLGVTFTLIGTVYHLICQRIGKLEEKFERFIERFIKIKE